MTVIQLKNIELAFDLKFNEQVEVFKDLDLKIVKSSKVGILGNSGSGKSSLFNIIANKIKFQGGKRVINGKIGLISQEPILNPWLTCEEIIEIECERYNLNIDHIDFLKLVGLEKHKNHLIYNLSGGEKQKIAFISTIASGSDIILADEPLGRLDHKTATRVLENMLQIVNKREITFIMATHDPNFINNFDVVYLIKDQKLVKK